MFNIVAARRGPHWQLRTVDDPAFGSVDEAQVLAESIAGVMKYVPIPDRELGVVGAVGNLALALYAVVGTRISLDQQLAALSPEERAHLLRLASSSAVPQPSATGAPAPAAAPRAASTSPEGRDAASVLSELGDTPVRAGVEDLDPHVGRVTTSTENAERDPNEALVEHVRPGQRVASVTELVAGQPDGAQLLDTLAPAPEVDGVPAAPELGG